MAEEEDSGVGPMLLAACKRGNMALLKKLIEDYGPQKIDPNSIDGLGNAALHYAAMGDHREIAEVLFQTFPNIDPSAQNYAGDTPVHKAVEKDHVEFLKILVAHGANTALLNKKKKDAASFARSNEARNIIRSAQLASKVQSSSSSSSQTNQPQQLEVSTQVPPNKFKAELDPDMIATEEDD